MNVEQRWQAPNLDGQAPIHSRRVHGARRQKGSLNVLDIGTYFAFTRRLLASVSPSWACDPVVSVPYQVLDGLDSVSIKAPDVGHVLLLPWQFSTLTDPFAGFHPELPCALEHEVSD